MANSVGPSGLTTATRAELLAYFTAAFEEIYGTDINLASDTPDGQMINIFIQALLDNLDLVTQVYNGFDPDNAIGNVLDQRVAINGIQRQAATYTTTDITLINTQSVNLYGLDQSAQPVYTVADSAGNQFQLVTTQTGLAPGTHVLLFQAATPGQVLTTPNTITTPVTVVLGVVSVNNPSTYITLGVNEESDGALKIRRQKSVSIPSQGYFQGLLGALENINGITSAFILENTGPTVDINGIPGHSIWVIVAGNPNVPLSTAWNSSATYSYGDIASSGGINYISIQNSNTNHLTSNTAWWAVYNPVAQTIYNYRNAGCGMYNSGSSGAQSYVVTQVDGSNIKIYWDSVVSQNLFIKFTANSLNGTTPPNISAIKSYMQSNYVLSVNEEVNINQIGTLVQLADPNTMATSSGFSLTAGGAYTNTLTPSSANNQFSVSSSNIIVLPMILACTGGTQTIVSGLVTGTVVSVVASNTIQFSTLGGYGSYTYAMVSGTGSVNATTGLYTAGSSAGTDVVRVTDALSNTMTATVTVIGPT